MITITVITCTYNASQVIDRTLDSVLSQDYANVEHLIIDGLSKDDTISKVNNYKNKSCSSSCRHTIRIISEKDKGLYDAMNKGLQIASGDYLVYLNAGDTFPQINTLSHIASCVGKDETMPGVLFGDTDVVDESGAFIRHRRLSPPENLSWRDFKNGMLVCHQSFYALTSLARAIPYNIYYHYSADVDWCIRIMKASEKEGRSLRNVHAVITNYLDGGMSIVNHRTSLQERFKVMCTHYGTITTILQHFWFAIRSIIKK